MPYKKNCGFREKAGVCTFKPAECLDARCKFFSLDYTVKAINKRVREETKNMKEMEKSLGKLKRSDRKKYIETKKQIKQIFRGIFYLGKAKLQLKGITITQSHKTLAKKILKKVRNGKTTD